MLSWGRTPGRAVLYSCLGRVEVGAATYQDDMGKVSLGKTSREYCKGPTNPHELGSVERQEKQTLIRIRDGRAENQDARRPWHSYMSLLQFKNNRHGTSLAFYHIYTSYERCTVFERIIRRCNTMNNKLHCDCQPNMTLFFSLVSLNVVGAFACHGVQPKTPFITT